MKDKEILRTQTDHSACDTCPVYNRGIPCGVRKKGVCKQRITNTSQTGVTNDGNLS